MKNAIIHATGSYAPDRVVSNAYFDQLLGEPVSDWLEENVQIYERRWAAENESVADMAAAAARRALEAGSLKAGDIDLLIIATDTPEYISPSTASKVQHMLGMHRAGTFDMNTACAGFVTALDTGAKYIRADENYRNVMVIGAYAMSKYLNMHDKKTVTLFADGAGAAILQASDEPGRGWLGSQLITKGEYYAHMGIYGGGSCHPITRESVEAGEHLLQFVHKFPKTLNPEIWSEMARHLCQKTGVKCKDVDHFFLTQININSIFDTMDRLGADRSKAPTIMHHYGYTGSACIPMAFDMAMREGRIEKGDLAFFIGSGGGLAFASAAFRL